VLSPEEQAIKTQMFAAYPSQAEVLKNFPVSEEMFRDAPTYNFRLPPHEGPLLYERWGWGISGAEWRDYVNRTS
jgi:hypothetical protein